MDDARSQLRPSDLGNPDWYNDPMETDLHLVGYRMMCVEDAVLVPPRSVDFGLTRVHLLLASLPRHEGARMVATTANEFRVETGSWSTTPMGPHALIVTPARVDGVRQPEPEVRDRIAATVGLLNAWQGPNVTYEKVTEFEVSVGGDTVTTWSSAVRSPASMRSPELDDLELARLSSAVQGLADLSDGQRNRTLLSLRWFERGTDGDGIDAFLRLWIAIETLAMPDTTNISPLVSLLASSYGISAKEVQGRFAVGRVFGLRGAIVHAGKRPSVTGIFLDFVAAIYTDALMATLGITQSRRAEEVLRTSPIDPLAGI